MSKNKEAMNEAFLRGNYFINYVREVHISNQIAGNELMMLNNSFIEKMMKEAGIETKG